MSSPINPILGGLMDAFNMANMFHNQRQQDQELAMRKARMEQDQQMQEADQRNQQTNLQMKLNAMGARPMTSSDELEASSGYRADVNTSRAPNADGSIGTKMVPTMAPSDLKGRIVKAGGQSYVLPSQQEREDLADKESGRELGRKVKETQALGDVKTQGAIAETRAKLEAFGTKVSPEIEKLTQGAFKAGSYVMPEHQDDYARAIVSFKSAEARTDKEAVHVVPMYGEKESGVAVIKRDGSVAWNAIPNLGRKFTKPDRAETPSEARLTQKDVQARLVQETGSQYLAAAGNEEEAIKRLRADAQSQDPKVATEFLRKNLLQIMKQVRSVAPKASAGAAAANDPQAVIDQLDQAIAGNGGGRGGTTPSTPARGGTRPAPAKASGPTKAAAEYLKKRGVQVGR